MEVDKNLKIKLLSIFLLSNMSVYLLVSTPSDTQIPSKETTIEYREDYVEVKVSGNLLTSFSQNKAVSLISKNKKVYIPYALLISQNHVVSDDISQEVINTSFLIYLPKIQLPKIINGQKFDLIPYGKHQFTKAKKRSYEIHI